MSEIFRFGTKLIYLKPLTINTIFFFLLIALLHSNTFSQGTVPNRSVQNFTPVVVDNFETIGLQNGSVMLNYPLAVLPPGRGGLNSAITLSYNSKPWNTVMFYDKLTFIYLEMPKFTKTLEELETSFDKWLYVLKHLPKLQERPPKLQERVFSKLFELAQIGKFNQEEMQKYEESLKVYWDIHAVVETAFDEGKVEGFVEGEAKGKVEGKIEVARNAILKGLNNEIIVELTNLSIEEIEKLRKE